MMKKTDGRREKIPYWVPGGLILIGGFCLLIFRLTHESFWNDEVYTWWMTNRSFIDNILLNINIYNYPPLYFLMVKAFTLIAGDSAFTIRLFSVLGACATAALGLGPVRRAGGVKTGLIFSGLIFLTPVILSMAQEGRMYTWAAFFVTGAVLYGYLAATGGHEAQVRASDWVKLGVFTLGAAYTHYWALMAVGVANLALLVWLLLKERRRLWPFLITMGGVLIAYLPWVAVFIQQTVRVKQSYWIPPVTADTVWASLFYPYGDKFFSWAPDLFIFRPYAFWLASAIILGGLWLTKKTKLSSLAFLALVTYLGTILAAILISLIRPILMVRYIMTIMGLFVLCIAIGLSALAKRKKFLGWIAGILLLALSLPAMVQIYQQRFNGPMADVIAYLKPKLTADAVFVHVEWHTLNTFSFYFPDHPQYLYQLEVEESSFSPQSTFGPNLDKFLQGRKDIWYVTRLDFPSTDIAIPVFAANKLVTIKPPKDFRLPYSWYGVSVSRLAPSQP